MNFLFDIFRSHVHGLFCSSAAECIKPTVVSEVYFVVLLATHHCKLHFSLLQSPFSADAQSCTSSTFQAPSVIALLMFLPLTRKGKKVKRKTSCSTC